MDLMGSVEAISFQRWVLESIFGKISENLVIYFGTKTSSKLDIFILSRSLGQFQLNWIRNVNFLPKAYIFTSRKLYESPSTINF